MILGQLIQTARRFCECRSGDFVPESEDKLVVILYTIHDRLVAHSVDLDSPDLVVEIQEQIVESEAIAYILIHRENQRSQAELPHPIGRKPMDRVTLTAATRYSFETESYFLDQLESVDAYRLVATSIADIETTAHLENLFPFEENSEQSTDLYLLPELGEFAG